RIANQPAHAVLQQPVIMRIGALFPAIANRKPHHLAFLPVPQPQHRMVFSTGDHFHVFGIGVHKKKLVLERKVRHGADNGMLYLIVVVVAVPGVERVYIQIFPAVPTQEITADELAVAWGIQKSYQTRVQRQITLALLNEIIESIELSS